MLKKVSFFLVTKIKIVDKTLLKLIIINMMGLGLVLLEPSLNLQQENYEITFNKVNKTINFILYGVSFY